MRAIENLTVLIENELSYADTEKNGLSADHGQTGEWRADEQETAMGSLRPLHVAWISVVVRSAGE